VDAVFVAPGDPIEGVDMEDGFLRGHGTQVVDGRLLATVCGTVERVNKLVSVRPLRSRYVPETGDVVLGRVTEIAGKRWKLDVNARQDAILQLSAVHLPGGVQRRRNAIDELNMRRLYGEDDLVSAEVQSFYADGAVALHTRSLKYGRLSRGQLVRVPPTLVKRVKQHFHRLDPAECGGADVEVLLGCNGFVWVGAPSAATSDDVEGNAGQEDAARVKEDVPVDAREREEMCRVANAVRVLSALFLAIHPPAIADVVRCSREWGVPPKDMLGTGFLRRTLERETERRIARGGA
jgi:exosome complex component RRP4